MAPRAYQPKKKRKGFRRYRNRDWYNKKFSIAQAAGLAYSASKAYKYFFNAEKKHSTLNWNSAAVNTSGWVNSLAAIAQGDTNITRNGNSILVKDLYIYAKFEIDADSVQNSQVRFIVFEDTQQVADTNPAVADVLDSASYISMLNTNSAGRFKIISNDMITLTPADGGSSVKIYKKYFKFPRMHIRYNGTGTGDIQKGGLYVLAISNEGTNYPTILGNARIGYFDN